MGSAMSMFPVVPNVPGFTRAALVSRSLAFELVSPPSPLFPDLSALDEEEAVARADYYISFEIFSGSVWLVAGTALLAAVGMRARRMSHATMELLPASDEERAASDFWPALLRKRITLACIMGASMAYNTALLLVALRRNSLSPRMGVAWEFWVAWSYGAMMSGLMEVVCLSCRPGERPLTLYVKAMLLTHTPVLSEKIDTAKDQVFIAMAIHEDYDILGYTMAVWLLACHAYFAYSRPVQTELLETYLPILTAGAKTGVGFLEGLPQEARLMVLKQVSPARQRIGLAEDIPQIFGMSFFAVTRGGLDQATFIVVSLVISLLRVLVAVPPVQRRIYDSMIEPIRQARAAALTAGNAPKVLHFTLVLWSVNPEESGRELKQVGWDAAELKEEGVSSERLKAATYSAEQLKSAGYSAKELGETLSSRPF